MNEEKDHYLVFVYGTLKQGLWNHSYLNEAEFIDKAKTTNKYALYVDRIPYVVKNEAVSYIFGEVYKVDDQIFSHLDQLEGHPDFYTREEIEVKLQSGKVITAWIYFNDNPSGSIDDSGNYKTMEI